MILSSNTWVVWFPFYCMFLLFSHTSRIPFCLILCQQFVGTYIWILSTSFSSDKICRTFYVFSLLMKNNVAFPQWHPPLKSLNLGYLNSWQCTNILSLKVILITWNMCLKDDFFGMNIFIFEILHIISKNEFCFKL